jgi:hypothetical protein
MPDKVGMDEPQEPLQRTITAKTLAAALLYELRGDPSSRARTLRYEIRVYLNEDTDPGTFLPGFEA